MKSDPECIACVFKQALNTARLVTDDPDVQVRILSEVAEAMTGPDMTQSPAALSKPAYAIVSRITGVADPYVEQKKETNRHALELLPELRGIVDASDDPLDAAIHAAVAGNVIDLGIGHEFDLAKDVKQMMTWPLAIDAVDELRNDMQPGKQVLYLGDNAGEIVFDILLIEKLLAAGLKVTYTVKSGPIINDATMTDAEDVGMTALVPVIETGSDDIGVHWDHVSDEFRAAFESADIIISKGHGNFETCNERSENVYFLLKAKCPIVAAELGVSLGDIVFKHSR